MEIEDEKLALEEAEDSSPTVSPKKLALAALSREEEKKADRVLPVGAIPEDIDDA